MELYSWVAAHPIERGTNKASQKRPPFKLYTTGSYLIRYSEWMGSVHYSDVIMSAMTSQITGGTIVYSTVCSGADKKKHQSSALLAFVRGIHRWPGNSRKKAQQRWKCFHLMTSSNLHTCRIFRICCIRKYQNKSCDKPCIYQCNYIFCFLFFYNQIVDGCI